MLDKLDKIYHNMFSKAQNLKISGEIMMKNTTSTYKNLKQRTASVFFIKDRITVNPVLPPQ